MEPARFFSRPGWRWPVVLLMLCLYGGAMALASSEGLHRAVHEESGHDRQTPHQCLACLLHQGQVEPSLAHDTASLRPDFGEFFLALCPQSPQGSPDFLHPSPRGPPLL